MLEADLGSNGRVHRHQGCFVKFQPVVLHAQGLNPNMNTFVAHGSPEKPVQATADFTVHPVDSTLQDGDFTMDRSQVPVYTYLFSVCDGCLA